MQQLTAQKYNQPPRWFWRLARKTAAALALTLTAAVLVAVFSSRPAQTQTPPTTTTTTPPTTATPDTTATVIPTSTSGNIPLLAATGCTDGTFVDTTANPVVSGANNDLVDDCQTLVQIHNYWAANTANNDLHTNHPLRTWGTGTTQKIDAWAGITITNNRITTINLQTQASFQTGGIPGPGINGSIPTQLGQLTALTSLSLGSNLLTGNIPTQLGQLANLTSLSLTGNGISGNIPTQLGNLTNLTSLDLRGNRLRGDMPTQLGNLTNLTTLNLAGNQFTGIPAQLGNLTNLTNLNLRINRLTGIPAQLGNLTNLTTLNLAINRLTGPIPAQLGNLTNLTSLNLYGNHLSGNIPAQLGRLTNLTELWLDSNWLSGSIPAELGNLAPSQGGSLASFRFCDNYLTGAVPAALRTGITLGDYLGDYPMDEGYDPVACQNTGSPPVKTPSTIPAVVIPYVPPATDPPPPTTTTTTTTTTAAVVPATAATLEPDRPGHRWNTLAVQRDGITASQIRQTLRLSSGYSIYTWNADTRTWARTTRPDQPIPPGALVSFRSEEAPDPNHLNDLNLTGGTRRASLARGWNLISVPASAARSDDSAGLLFAAQLIDCENQQSVLAVANYSPRSRLWSLWLPCHPAAQARLTTGGNPPYRPLTAVSPADTTYIYARASRPLNIAWNTQTRTYQPS